MKFGCSLWPNYYSSLHPLCRLESQPESQQEQTCRGWSAAGLMPPLLTWGGGALKRGWEAQTQGWPLLYGGGPTHGTASRLSLPSV